MAQDVTSWSEMRQVYNALKKTEVKQLYKNIVIDTVDVLSDMCTRYICNQKGIESLGDMGFGKGWTAFKDEFNEVFRGLTQLGYSVIFLGHSKETISEDGSKITIRPSLGNSTRAVIEGMSDIIGYAHQKSNNEMSVLTLRANDDSIVCGTRFKYMKAEIPMNYTALVQALSEAIEKEAEENDGQFITDEKMTITPEKTYDYEAMMEEFQNIVGDLMSKNQSNAPKITSIVEKYLGKGKKAGDATPAQCEQLELILLDLKEL